MNLRWHAAIVLVIISIAIASFAQSTSPDQSSPKDTQIRGYWVDPTTRLMWAAKDNGKEVSWHAATRFCRKLRLAGYSDWRLPTIDELEEIYDKNAETPGLNPKSHWHPAEPMNFHVKGGLFFTDDRQWSSNQEIDAHGRPVSASYWYFDYQQGRKARGFEDIAEGDFNDALCVRDPVN